MVAVVLMYTEDSFAALMEKYSTFCDDTELMVIKYSVLKKVF